MSTRDRTTATTHSLTEPRAAAHQGWPWADGCGVDQIEQWGLYTFVPDTSPPRAVPTAQLTRCIDPIIVSSRAAVRWRCELAGRRGLRPFGSREAVQAAAVAGLSGQGCGRRRERGRPVSRCPYGLRPAQLAQVGLSGDSGTVQGEQRRDVDRVPRSLTGRPY